jgi:hypothetical protein
VRRREDTHIRTEHDALPDSDQAAVQDGEIEVGVEPVAERDVAAVVDSERRLDEGVLPDVAQDRAESVHAVCGEGVEVWVAGCWGEVLGLR